MNERPSVMAEIKAAKLLHRNWLATNSGFIGAINAAQPGEVICLTGPSRVGKSNIFKDTKNRLQGDAFDDDTHSVVYVDARNSGTQGSFSTKGFALACLDAIDHPVYSLKGRTPETTEIVLRRRVRAVESELSQLFEVALTQRNVKIFAIDEVHHIAYARGGMAIPSAILDSFKCLAENTGVILVLIGAYPILNVLKLNPHMIGRLQMVHFERYRGTVSDIAEFNAILRAYSSLIPLRHEDDLLRQNEFIYSETFGCVGLLSIWLRRAVATMETQGRDVLQIEHLVDTRMPEQLKDVLVKEIKEGEKFLTKKPPDLGVIDKREMEQDKKLKRPKRRPFERKPKRRGPNCRT